MDSNFMDLTCSHSESRGTKRPSMKLTSHPRKRRRSVSTLSTTPSVGPSSRNDSSRDSSSSFHQQTRRVGDGLDCRRPAPTAGSHNNPIDLSIEDDDNDISILPVPTLPSSRPRQPQQQQTQLQPQLIRNVQPPLRGPRHTVEIITIDERDNTGREEHLRRHQNAVRQNYPLWLPIDDNGNPLPPPSYRRYQPNPARPAPAQAQPYRPEVVEIDDDDDDLFVENTRHDTFPMFNTDEAAMIRNRLSGRTAITGANTAHAYTRGQNLMNRIQSIRNSRAPIGPPLHAARQPGFHLPDFVAPAMDYAVSAFDFMTGRYPEPIRHTPAPPAYEPLPPCADGFTRSPQDGDVLVCPRCDRELCLDEPTPMGQSSTKDVNLKSPAKKANTKENEGVDEVWVVKACGHVYCGACARLRKPIPKKNAKSKASPAKGKGKGKEPVPAPSPFSNCLIEGCDEKLSGKALMIQLFL